MLEDTTAIEAALDAIENETPSEAKEAPVRWIPATELEEAYIWKKANKYKIIGQLSPCVTSGPGARAPVVWDFILPDSTAVDYLNGFCDSLGLKPRSKTQWRNWMRDFANNPPPDGPLQTFKYKRKKGSKSGGPL